MFVHCVDDVIVLELLRAVMSAFVCWRSFAELCGRDVPDAKSPPPEHCFRALGAIVYISGYPAGPLLLCLAEVRIANLMEPLLNVRVQLKLSPALAGKFYGKFMFMSSQYVGRFGRALFRALSRRQHESRFAMNPLSVAAIHFWIKNMRDFHPR